MSKSRALLRGVDSIFPEDPLHSKRVFKYNALPVGWVLMRCEPRSAKPPFGWQWAHNDRDMFSKAFRLALVRVPDYR